MKFAVVGSRNITDYELVKSILLQYNITHIVSGGAKGIDILSEQYADENNLPKTIFKPEYDKYGKAAPFIRNKQIIDEAECVIAIWDGKSTGTKHSIGICQKQHKPLYVWNNNAEIIIL